MHYLNLKNLRPGMVLAKPIIGDNGSVLLRENNTLSETTLRRIVDMGFQGAYINEPAFDDVIVDNIIDDDLRLNAFLSLKQQNIQEAVHCAKDIVRELKYKEVLKLDLMDIKNDKNYDYKHCISVCIFSTVLGVSLELNEEQLGNLAVAGLLHDIGKFEINETVRFSQNRFNKSDMDEMKRHPIISYELLKDYPFVSSISRNAILFHHENMDGSGYYNVEEDKLGLFPRILRVVDVYDSLTALKKYRPASSPSDAIEYLMGHINTLFDSRIVRLFMSRFPLYPVGFTVLLSNGTPAVIVNNSINSMRPCIRLFDGTNIDLSSDPHYRSVTITEFI
ncbi:MAG: HD domain-containing protein [Lachnospiraceae bacterium]